MKLKTLLTIEEKMKLAQKVARILKPYLTEKFSAYDVASVFEISGQLLFPGHRIIIADRNL